ncbi:MAG: hypothetical protein GDA39_08780, partial [Hyphomonadaceae bacterium]|nr:hypothetical protein [Hyphomonadaceae bacterium]
MNSDALTHLLDSYRRVARTGRDMGTMFERLSAAYLTHDPVQAGIYEDVKPYADWAHEQG